MNTLLFYTSLFTFYLFSSSLQQMVKILGLDEGNECRQGDGQNLKFRCVQAANCKSLINSLNKNQNVRNNLDICSFDGSQPIVCCPQAIHETPEKKVKNSYSADEMCRQYSELTYGEPRDNALGSNADISDEIVHAALFDGEKDEEKQYPHMVLVGYGSIVYHDTKLWGCGGTLISSRWILTAGHCKYMGDMEATWARLGVSSVKKGTSKDYRIVQHVVHQGYKPPSRYNDIALFGLETDVEFSKYIKPICLNSNKLLNPKTQIATGWGRTSARLPSNDLLKLDLNVISANECNSSYFSSSNLKQLEFGIKSDKMLCAVPVNDADNTCLGDTGGPLQVENFNDLGMFMQFGVMSFGKFCGDKDAPNVFTKVSSYISAIEAFVWPKFRSYSMDVVTSVADCEKYVPPKLFIVSGNTCLVNTHIESNLL